MEQTLKRNCHKPISILGFLLSGETNDNFLLNTLKALFRLKLLYYAWVTCDLGLESGLAFE